MLYDLALPLLNKGDKIIIDMDGVNAVPTMFMNVSFGKLVDEFGKMKVMRSINFYNINKAQLDRFKNYFKEYKERTMVKDIN